MKTNESKKGGRPPNKEKKTSFSMQVTDEALERFKTLVKTQGKTLNFAVEEAIQDYIKKYSN